MTTWLASSIPKTWPNTKVVTQQIDRLAEVASRYDAIVLDQWGVLHDGSTPYPNAVSCLTDLAQSGTRFAVLSNSGKRAAPNLDRIAQMGFATHLFEQVMTSGEALWRDVDAGRLPAKRLYPIERARGDAAAWAEGLSVTFTDHLADADATLLMGLPDGNTLSDWQDTLAQAHARNLPIYCSNPDRASPRADRLVISPGALAFAYLDLGGDVQFYGKPHTPIFTAVQRALGTANLLMVGDSLEHDIAGAQAAGWDSLLVRGGLYASDFASGDTASTLARLVAAKGCRPPTYMIGDLT